MKRLGIVMAMSVIAICGLFANGRQESVTVEGKLVVKDSIPTIVSGDKTWNLPVGPFYQIAWENGIKVGDTIKAEGTVITPRGDLNASGTDKVQVESVLIPTKAWVNGKEINLSTVKFMGPRNGMGPGMAQGRRGRSDRGGRDCPMWDDDDDARR